MLKLLFKTIAFSFYQQHAGFFLVVFYLFFGAVEGSQLVSYHKAILMAICASPVVLACTFFVWMVYAGKALLFVKQKIDSREYGFLSAMYSVMNWTQLQLWMKLFALLLAPILIYAMLIVAMAINIGAYLTVFIVVAGLIVLIAGSSLIIFRVSNFSFLPHKTWIKFHWWQIRKPFWTWPLFFLFSERTISFLMAKILSIFFFKAVLFMFADLGPHLKVYLTAILAATLSHAVLVFNLIKFNASSLSFVKTLPLSIARNFLNSCLIYLILLIPEFLLLGWLTKFHFIYLWPTVLFGFAMMLTLQLMVYTLKADMERYLKYLLFVFFVSMMAILTGYAIVYSMCMLFLSGLLFFQLHAKIDLKTIA